MNVTGGEIDLSVVVSCYFEEQSIDLFHRRLSETLRSLGRSYEIIFVNDGSTDGTFDRLKEIFDKDRRVSAVVDLFRNVGQSNAMTAGVVRARGEALVLMDSDLQLDPEELPLLVGKYGEGFEIVSGYRRGRKDSLARRVPSMLANSIMRKASRSTIRDFGCTFKLYDGRLVRAFEFGPMKPWRHVPVIAQAGRIAEVPVSHHSRAFGHSGWTFRKLFEYNMENIVNLTQKPFQFLSLACLLLALLLIVRVTAGFVFHYSLLPRVTTGLLLNAVVVSLLAVLSVLAVIGEFIIRNFIVLQRKPAYIIREILERKAAGRT